jgi:endonuclease-3 related protein
VSAVNSPRLRQICDDLITEYAASDWWPAASPFEVMIGAVLVQNTRWVNVERALARLRDHRALSPAAIAAMTPARLTDMIRSAGCQTVKSRRLIALSRWLIGAGGIMGLRSRRTERLRAELLAVHGIGPETADAILCFALRRPVFIADGYARRLFARLGVLAAGTAADYEDCRAVVQSVLRWPARKHQHLHGAIIRLSQTVCRRTPLCAACGLRQRCAYSRRQTSSGNRCSGP